MLALVFTVGSAILLVCIRPTLFTSTVSQQEIKQEIQQGMQQKTQREIHQKIQPGSDPATFPSVTSAVVIPKSNDSWPKPVATEQTTSPSRGHGYILSLSDGGQQGAGARGLVSQQCWAGSFGLPMYIVEPFIQSSTFDNTINAHSIKSALKFRDYFDIKHFNHISENKHYPQLASWEDFLKNAPRQVIYVNMRKRNGKGEAPSINWEAGNSQHSLARTKLPSGMHILTEHNFRVVKAITLSYNTWYNTRAFKKSELNDAIFKRWNPAHVTVVFTLWTQFWYVPNHKLKKPSICGPAVSEMNLQRTMFYPSEQLIKHVKYYEEQFQRSKTSVAVMMRVERSLMGGHSEHIRFCLKQTKSVALKKWQNHPSGSIFATVDIGKYASTSFKKTYPSVVKKSSKLLKEIKDTMLSLYYGRTKWTFSDWEKSFTKATGGIDDNGYIAALQRTIASRADCLVLMGGGNFQRLAVYEYAHIHLNRSKWCICLVCLSSTAKREFSYFFKTSNLNRYCR